MAAVVKYGWFKRMGDEEGGGTHAVKWWQRPLIYRVSSSTWSSRRRATTTTVDITGRERRIRRTWRKKAVDIVKDLLFQFVSVFETVFLVATLCFFYVRFGFQI